MLKKIKLWLKWKNGRDKTIFDLEEIFKNGNI